MLLSIRTATYNKGFSVITVTIKNPSVYKICVQLTRQGKSALRKYIENMPDEYSRKAIRDSQQPKGKTYTFEFHVFMYIFGKDNLKQCLVDNTLQIVPPEYERL